MPCILVYLRLIKIQFLLDMPKHRKTSGYSKESMPKDIASINENAISGEWRRVSICNQPIVMTVIEQFGLLEVPK